MRREVSSRTSKSCSIFNISSSTYTIGSTGGRKKFFKVVKEVDSTTQQRTCDAIKTHTHARARARTRRARARARDVCGRSLGGGLVPRLRRLFARAQSSKAQTTDNSRLAVSAVCGRALATEDDAGDEEEARKVTEQKKKIRVER